MPKRRSPDRNHFTYRLELQQTERDALELLSASMAAKNIANGVGSLASPLLNMSVTSGLLFGSMLTAWLGYMGLKELDKDSAVTSQGLQMRLATHPSFIEWVGKFNALLESDSIRFGDR